MRGKRKVSTFLCRFRWYGLAIGEALGIKVQDISPDCSTIKIVQKAWRSQIHNFFKTDSGSREIDLCPALASMLKAYLGYAPGNTQVPSPYFSRNRASPFMSPMCFGAR